MLRVEDSHESESRGSVERAGVEQDGRDRDLPLELLQHVGIGRDGYHFFGPVGAGSVVAA